MKKKPGKGAVFAMNLALPGLGQLVSGRWITGGIFLLLALLFFGLGVWFALAPLFAMIREMLDNPGSTAEYRIELVNVFCLFRTSDPCMDRCRRGRFPEHKTT